MRLVGPPGGSPDALGPHRTPRPVPGMLRAGPASEFESRPGSGRSDCAVPRTVGAREQTAMRVPPGVPTGERRAPRPRAQEAHSAKLASAGRAGLRAAGSGGPGPRPAEDRKSVV